MRQKAPLRHSAAQSLPIECSAKIPDREERTDCGSQKKKKVCQGVIPSASMSSTKAATSSKNDSVMLLETLRSMQYMLHNQLLQAF